jgi:hypothetical protein
MRTTLRIDDDLLRTLKQWAVKENLSLCEMVNRTLRHGLDSATRSRKKVRRKFRQRVSNMGVPKFNVNKALAFAGELEDQETLRKMALGK